MADVYRIEIPVELVNNTDTGSLEKMESILQKLYSSLQRNTAAAKTMTDAVNGGAMRAGSAMEQVAESAEDAADSYENTGEAATKSGNEQASASKQAEQAADKLADSVTDTAEAFQESGNAAKQAGTKSGSAFSQASGNVDKFTQRIEKSNQSLRKMFAQKLQFIISALDKASPIISAVYGSVKNITAKAWNVTVKMLDMVTAPFRQLKNMIMSPITMTLSLAGIGMGASSFVDTFSDFVTGMSNVKALSGATAEEFALLTDKAEELGATTKFTASEAAEGMQYLAMAGWKTNDIIAAMPGLLDLAAAGGTSLGTAADIVSDVMTAMGMAADEASRAADIFARTATGTNTTIENLGETLKYAAPIAHSFGLELSEVSTITGMMANAGIKGSQAGTAIRSSLMEMASPAAAAQEVMKKLNLTFSDTNGKMNDLGTIVHDLSEAFKGLSEQEKLAYAEDLFGTYASSAWLGVIEQGADEYERLFKSIDQSNGAAKEMANTQLDNLTGDVTLLQSAVDGMKISIMKELDPYLRQGVQWLTGKIPALTGLLTDFIKTGIEKGTQLKTFLQEVFSSSDFQNAEGFAEKFFVAWDKIIAEPFSNWWEGNGRQTILGAVEKIGGGIGDMYHGIITGIFAAIKGEEINFDGLNLSGLAKAGAEAAKAFIEAFKESLDLGSLFNDAPGLLKAGLFGFGTIKIGGWALGMIKTIAQVKTAFTGVTVAAGTAATATNTVAASTVTAAAGAGKLASLLTMVKTGLAAIPVWGWVAAAALTAVTVGIIAYSNAQKQHEQDLLDTGKAAARMADQYVQSTELLGKAMDAIDDIKEIQLRIAEDKGGNAEVIEQFKKELHDIEHETILITATLTQGGLPAEEQAELESQLKTLEEKAQIIIKSKLGGISPIEKALLNLQIATLSLQDAQIYSVMNAPTENDITKMNELIAGIELQKAQAQAQLNQTIDPQEVNALNGQIQALVLAELTIKAKVGSLTETETAQANALVAELGKTADALVLKAALGNLTDEDIAAANGIIAGLELNNAVIRTIIDAGDGTLTEEESANLKALIDAIEANKAEIEAKLKNDGALTDAEKAALQAEIDGLNKKQVIIDSLLSNGGNLDATTKAALISELEELNQKKIVVSALVGNPVDDSVLTTWLAENSEKKATITATLDDSGYSTAQVAIISLQLAAIKEGEKSVTLTIADNTELTPTEIADYVTQLTDLFAQKSTYEFMIEGFSLSPEAVAEQEAILESITSKQAVIEAVINKGQGTMSDEEWTKLLEEGRYLSEEAAKIKLVLEGSKTDYEQIQTIKEQLAQARGDAAAILLNIAYSKNSNISQEQLDKMIADLNSIGEIEASLNIQLKEGSLGAKELEELNKQLEQAYVNLVEASGGYFTEEDVKRGRISQERLDQQIASMEADAMLERAAFRQQVEADRENNIPELVEMRNAANATAQYYEANANGGVSDYDFLAGIEAQRKVLLAEYLSGPQDDAATEKLMAGGQELIQQARERQWSDVWGAPANFEAFQAEDLFGKTVKNKDAWWDFLGLTSHWEADASVNPLAMALDELQGYVGNQDTSYDEATAKASAANAALVKHYQNEVRLVETESFAGFGVQSENSRASIQELAANYASLDEAGQQMFTNAIAGITELNNTATYISEEEKINVQELITQASLNVTKTAGTEILGDIKAKLLELSTTYQGLQEETAKADFNADKLEAVNKALESLGLDKIGDLSELSEKLKEITSIDPSKLNFNAACDSLTQLTGSAAEAEAITAKAKQQLEALAGTYNVTIKYNTVGSIPNPPVENAMGGIYDGAFLSWVAEDGPEAIIPLGADKRGRGLDLWMQAGRMLGVQDHSLGIAENAMGGIYDGAFLSWVDDLNGGVTSPYSDILEDIPDDIWDGKDLPSLVPDGGNAGTGRTAGNTIHVSVTVEPTYEIKSENTFDVMEEIRSHQPEIAEMVGAGIAAQIEDIFDNLL